MELYSTVKNNDGYDSHWKINRTLKISMSNKMNQSEKDKYYILFLIYRMWT